MEREDFYLYVEEQIPDNEQRLIHPEHVRAVFNTLAENVLFKNELPFEYNEVDIIPGMLNENFEYTHNHGLDCYDPVYYVRWTDNEIIRGDGFFTIKRLDANNQLITFMENIAWITIIAYKFK